MSGRPALFLDRDGVVVRDLGGLVRAADLCLIEGAADPIVRARAQGRAVVVVTNQAVVARGLVSEDEVRDVNRSLGELLVAAGAKVDAFYFCPHHPRADVPRYRVECECRKPRPGMLRRAARELELDLSESAMVGDRLSDIAAGASAGCQTVLVETGEHRAAPIESVDGPIDARPDHVAPDLSRAVDWVLRRVG
jgi:D-glycero-D-manno-heptose 1,7-bisphosphate phosphatase